MTTASAAQRLDVLVVGGSFVGLAFASALVKTLGDAARIGLVASGDSGSVGADDVRASAIAAGSQRLLHAIGAWHDIAADAQPVARIELTDSSLEAGVRPVLTRYDNVLEGDEPASYIVPNAVIGAALARTASALAITRFNGRLVDFRITDHGAEVTLDDGTLVATALVVAADGRGSEVRRKAGIEVLAFGRGQSGIVTRVRHELPHEGTAVQHFLPGGPFAILPLTGQRACITWSETEEEARRVMALDDAGFLGEVDRRIGGRLGVIELDGTRQTWPLGTQLARAYVGRRLALVGDAVHGVHPIAGQGMNLGFRDVAALVEVLADAARVGLDLGDATALARYERWRRFDSFFSATAFEGLNRLFSNDITLLRSVREVGLGLVDRMPALKRMLVREAAGLTGRVPLLLKGELPG